MSKVRLLASQINPVARGCGVTTFYTVLGECCNVQTYIYCPRCHLPICGKHRTAHVWMCGVK